MTGRRALVITSPGSIGLQDAPDLVPGPGEVVARPVYTGICGTDLELLAGVVDPAYVRYPLVPGHEWSGVIEAVGPGVTGLEPGQPVIAEGIIPDRICAECVQGHTNLCVVYDELGFTRAGAAADQVLLPAQVVHALGVRSACSRRRWPSPPPWPGGPSAAAARGRGAGRGRRRRYAGPDHRAPAPALLARRADRLRAAPGPGRPGRRARRDRIYVDTPDEQFNLVIEAAGTAGAVERALGLARRGGRVVLVGLAGNDVKAAFGIDNAVNNDLLISASFAYTSAAFAGVTELLRAGQIRPAPLVTHRFPLEAYDQAYQVLRAASGRRGKVMLEVGTP